MLKALTLLGLLVVVSLALIGERSKSFDQWRNIQQLGSLAGYFRHHHERLGPSGLNIYLDKIQVPS
jgi:hypothetical protein